MKSWVHPYLWQPFLTRNKKKGIVRAPWNLGKFHRNGLVEIFLVNGEYDCQSKLGFLRKCQRIAWDPETLEILLKVDKNRMAYVPRQEVKV